MTTDLLEQIRERLGEEALVAWDAFVRDLPPELEPSNFTRGRVSYDDDRGYVEMYVSNATHVVSWIFAGYARLARVWLPRENFIAIASGQDAGPSWLQLRYKMDELNTQARAAGATLGELSGAVDTRVPENPLGPSIFQTHPSSWRSCRRAGAILALLPGHEEGCKVVSDDALLSHDDIHWMCETLRQRGWNMVEMPVPDQPERDPDTGDWNTWDQFKLLPPPAWYQPGYECTDAEARALEMSSCAIGGSCTPLGTDANGNPEPYERTLW